MRYRMLALLVAVLMVSTGFAGMASAATENERLETGTGTTSDFGGGDYVYVKFKKDAFFGVVYGTETSQNSIVIVAGQVRYLGGAEVYDDNGAKIGHRVPIRVFTVFAQKLEDIFEFNDTDGDGICDYRRAGPGVWYNQYPLHEPIYKRVSLQTAWERSEITTTTDEVNMTKTWEFSLSAKNLPYIAVGDSDSIRRDVKENVLDEVKFTFHLEASVKEHSNISVPMYKVTVQKDGGEYTVMDSERIEDIMVSGKHLEYRIKYDHLIKGWDFDPTNANPMLLLEWHAIAANAIPEKVAKWIRMQFVERIQGDGKVTVDTEDGQEVVDDENTISMEPKRPKRFAHPRIELIDNWQKVGRLTWVTNVTVDGQEKSMYAQVQGGVPFQTTGERGVLRGFAVLGGYSYPGGQSIYHDPEMSSDIAVELNLGGQTFKTGLGSGLLGVMLVGVGFIAAAGVAYSLKKRKESSYEDLYEREEEEKTLESYK